MRRAALGLLALLGLIAGAALFAATAGAQDVVSLGTTGYGTPLSPAQITSTQNNYAPPGCHNRIVWRLTSDAARSITGISAATCAQTTKTAVRVLWNVGSFAITLEDDDAGSTAANRIQLRGDLALDVGHAITLVYDPTSQRWRPDGADGASGGGFQPLDSDLTAIAALTTTGFGLGLLDDADAAAARASLNLGATEISIAINGGAGVYSGTVTGQPTITTSSRIVCAPAATSADGGTVELYDVAEFTVATSNRVGGTGFDVRVYSPNGATGTFRFACNWQG